MLDLGDMLVRGVGYGKNVLCRLVLRSILETLIRHFCEFRVDFEGEILASHTGAYSGTTAAATCHSDSFWFFF